MQIKKLFLLAISMSAMNLVPQTILEIIRDKTKNENEKIAEINKQINAENVNNKSKDIPYFTPLMRAADLGHLKIVNFLLEHGANINEVDNLNTPAIFYAARKGHHNIVQSLLSKGASITGITKQGNTILLDILRSYGANLSAAQDRQQFKTNVYNTIKLLINNGANINKQGSKEELARSPIMWAAFWKDMNLVRLLEEKGADITAKDQLGNDLSFYLPDPSKDKDLNPADIAFINELKKEISAIELIDWTVINK